MCLSPLSLFMLHIPLVGMRPALCCLPLSLGLFFLVLRTDTHSDPFCLKQRVKGRRMGTYNKQGMSSPFCRRDERGSSSSNTLSGSYVQERRVSGRYIDIFFQKERGGEGKGDTPICHPLPCARPSLFPSYIPSYIHKYEHTCIHLDIDHKQLGLLVVGGASCHEKAGREGINDSIDPSEILFLHCCTAPRVCVTPLVEMSQAH